MFITGPLNEPVLFCLLTSFVSRRRLSSAVTQLAGGPAVGAWTVGWWVADTARRASMGTSR